MHIRKLYIQNFRGFERREICLNTNFTVAIGDNGIGKSSLLYALQVALGAYLQCLPIPASSVYRRQFKKQERYVRWSEIEKDYIYNTDETSIKVEAEFYEENHRIEWRRVMLANNSTSHNRLYSGELIDAVANLLNSKLSEERMLPVVASFGTDRTHSQLRKGKRAQSKRSRMEKGYLAALTDNVDFNGVIEWLHNYDSNLKYEKEFFGTREALFEAISIAIPYLQEVGYNPYYQELEAVVSVDKLHVERKTHSNMSDGLISMLNMVAELAFRCVILNGFKERNCVKLSKGVVMIDELDMHLHPNWQRHVVENLRNAFPNIQFVVTTHSPFIVQSVREEELIIIDESIDKDGDPFKKSVEEISEAEMGVEDIPRSKEFLEMQDVAEKYFNLVKSGKSSDSDSDTAALKAKLKDLEERFSEDPAYVAALKIERKSNGL